MGNSLQDQFLKMGLVDRNKYNENKKQRHEKKKTGTTSTEVSEMAKKALADKKQEAKQQNKKRQADQRAKENTAKARQLIETHQITSEGEIAYNFKDNSTIKKIYLPQKTIDNLAQGKTGIVKTAGEYRIVPADIIYKIRELNKKLVILFNPPTSGKEKKEDDPYAGFEVPDDLMW